MKHDDLCETAWYLRNGFGPEHWAECGCATRAYMRNTYPVVDHPVYDHIPLTEEEEGGW